MDGTPPLAELLTFIVRVSDDEGHLSGVIERVRTGEKVRFTEPAAIGPLIARIVDAEREQYQNSRGRDEQ
jgi:antitoxin (DNA-binding transcriptional repressor) of toxin-antitoxin stability system